VGIVDHVFCIEALKGMQIVLYFMFDLSGLCVRHGLKQSTLRKRL